MKSTHHLMQAPLCLPLSPIFLQPSPTHHWLLAYPTFVDHINAPMLESKLKIHFSPCSLTKLVSIPTRGCNARA
jgi:hypothetical protein